MSKSKTKSWFCSFDQVTELGAGGNANVYLVKEKITGQQYALKELRNMNREKKARFISEIQIVKENSVDIPGILPMVECDCTNYWYTMPVAQPIMDSIKEKRIEEIIHGVVQLCETLEILHDKKIYHRDIKPSNIYSFKERFSLGDFGLVDFPDNCDYTETDKGLGAIFTIAPEMKRNPKIADAGKADVFSLAKTMWMFLTGDEKGFDGVYNYLDESHSLRYVSRFKGDHLVEIDELLKDSTQNDPNLRPDIHIFKERLLSWCEIANDFNKSQNSDWEFLTQQLFGKYVPSSSTWRETDDIIAVLNIVGKTPAYNHMLLSSFGGLDFSYAAMANEEKWIYLYSTSGTCHLVKPKLLQYERFCKDYRWSYFRLDLEKSTPIVDLIDKGQREHLVEDVPGHYVDATYVQYGVYDYDTGRALPDGYREVIRYVEGSFLFVLKKGPYNYIPGAYDGRHGLFECDSFRIYIETLMEQYLRLYEIALGDEHFKELDRDEQDSRILGMSCFNHNPFISTDENLVPESVMEDTKILVEKKHAFIEEKYKVWCFYDAFCSYTEYPEAPIRFFFEFKKPADGSIIGSIDGRKYCICYDGFIKEVEHNDFEECIFVRNRKAAVEILENIVHMFEEYLNVEGLGEIKDYYRYFNVFIRRDGTLNHLFEKSELECAMRTADDRCNNQLVIDENGYVRIITDDENGILYPVCLESWQAGNNYVGKFSKLDTLDDDYKSCLYGWLQYLTMGRSQYINYPIEEIEEECLISEIKQFYG